MPLHTGAVLFYPYFCGGPYDTEKTALPVKAAMPQMPLRPGDGTAVHEPMPAMQSRRLCNIRHVESEIPSRKRDAA